MSEQKKQPISLESLVPQDATFELESKPGVTLKVRKLNLNDQVWLREQFPDQDILDKAFTGMDPTILSRLIYHQMDQPSRKEFKAYTKTECNEEGEEEEIRVTGIQAFRESIVGTKEFIKVFNALMKTVGISVPSLDNIQAEEVKKNGRAEAVAESTTGPTGHGSVTDSAASTDGQ